ncbi:S8 family peptidase [Niallia sp. 01092]|uniref:S8 family peptidase n=1 Tax=unclassified Niallia TaxID=2837522 RepID=UPI003FD5C3EF
MQGKSNKIEESQKETWGFKDTVINSNATNNRVKIAILDSGINKQHPDLKGQIYKEFNAVNSQEPAADHFNHGTSIAGIIAAKDNVIGIKGISPKSEIYSVKVLDDNGKGSIDTIIKGIEWSINEKVDIINISFGMKNNNQTLHNVINKAVNNGIIVVASSGNNYIGDIDYPAKYSNVISVGSVDRNHKRVKFSPKGKIDIVAPGREILSTNNFNGYSTFEGTSYSTAYVTGLISLYISQSPNKNLKPEAVFKLLKNKSLDLGTKGKDDVYGYGLLQYK